MMETLCYPYDCSSGTRSEILVELLRQSIEHVAEDQHHPVLYQTLGALHAYIGGHQQRLMEAAVDLRVFQQNNLQEGAPPPPDTTTLPSGEPDFETISTSLRAPSEEFLVTQNVEVEIEERFADTSIDFEDEDDNSIGENNSMESFEEEDPDIQVRHTNNNPHKKEKQEAEEKLQEFEHDVASSKALQEPQLQEESAAYTTKTSRNAPVVATSVTPPTAPIIINGTAHSASAAAPITVEQQKKLVANRRKQDLELQRKLARADQRRKELSQKRKFMEQELRKQELVAKVASQRIKEGANVNNATDALRQIHQQMVAIDAEIKQKQAESTQLKAEMVQRKHQPLQKPAPATTSHASPALVQQQRMAEQARKGKTLEDQKKAAAEKKRQEFEEQRRKAREEQKRKDQAKKRRFMEQEQRKQDLMAKAKIGGGGNKTDADTADSVLLKKLSNQMTALDKEATRKKAEDAKKKEAAAEKEKQEEELNDPETARKFIAERARQKEIQEEVASTSTSPAMQHRKTTSINSTGSASSEAERRGDGLTHSSQQQQDGMSIPPAPGNFGPGKQGAQMNQQQHYYQGQAPQSPNLQHQYQQAQRTSPQTPPVQHQYRQHPTSPPQSWGSPQHEASPRQTHQRQHQTSQPKPDPSSAGARKAPQATHQPPSGTDQKYTKMAEQSGDDSGEAAFTDLKRKIIVHWGLQPPDMQSLRQIDQLLRTIQTVFPPSNDVPAHEYFDGWKSISDKDLLGPSGALDEKKLSKAVRKLRFFLHPDKLPRDLTDEQQFMCKLLWDVINDAWEDYKKAQEELDWMNN